MIENNKFIKITASIALASVVTLYTSPIFAYKKEESVYSKIDENGKNYKTIVSAYLENTEEAELIKDFTNLINIENTNGDESFSKDGNSLIWEAKGNDIYYKGESEKELPVDCTIKYELDGKEISAKDIANKSGKIKIKIKFKNKDKHIVSINGKEETLYTPFVVMCGTYIDNENNRNIKVSNGKVINDGSKSIVAGIALPGMNQSIGIEDLDIPDEIELTMDSKNFEMNNILIYVTPKVFEEDEIEIFDKLDKLYESVDTIQVASRKLEEGSNKLEKGTSEYTSKSKEFNTAMKKVQNGISTANNSYSKINDGIGALKSNSNKLKNGAYEINEGVNQAVAGLNEISKNLDTSINSLSKPIASGIKEVRKNIDKIAGTTSLNSKAYNNTENMNQVIKNNKNTIKDLDKANEKLDKQISLLEKDKDEEGNLKYEDVISSLKEQKKLNTSTKNDLSASNKVLESKVNNVKAMNQGSADDLKKLSESLEKLEQSSEYMTKVLTEIKAGNDTLAKQAENKLAIGTQQLYNGTKELSTGTEKLDSGSKQIKKGLNTLDTSTKKLTNANDKLVTASKEINKGAKDLSSGIKKFNNDAINKICGYVNKDIKNMQARIEALEKLSNSYNNFTLVNKDEVTEAKTEFIMVVDKIKKSDDKDK